MKKLILILLLISSTVLIAGASSDGEESDSDLEVVNINYEKGDGDRYRLKLPRNEHTHDKYHNFRQVIQQEQEGCQKVINSHLERISALQTLIQIRTTCTKEEYQDILAYETPGEECSPEECKAYTELFTQPIEVFRKQLSDLEKETEQLESLQNKFNQLLQGFKER